VLTKRIRAWTKRIARRWRLLLQSKALLLESFVTTLLPVVDVHRIRPTNSQPLKAHFHIFALVLNQSGLFRFFFALVVWQHFAAIPLDKIKVTTTVFLRFAKIDARKKPDAASNDSAMMIFSYVYEEITRMVVRKFSSHNFEVKSIICDFGTDMC